MKKILLLALFLFGCASPHIKEVNEGVVPGSGAEAGKKYYYVTGEVRKPGEYEIKENEAVDVYQAIMRAGGIMELRTEKEKILLFRSKSSQREVLKINLTKIETKKDITSNRYLEPGDILHVTKNIFAAVGDFVSLLLSPIKGVIELSTVSLGAAAAS